MSDVVKIAREGDLAWVVIDNPPVNATSQAVRAGLERAVSEVAGARLSILICAGRSFVAGGDMSEFDAPPVPPHLPDVVNAIEASETPFLAAMHGNVLGGGFEIALACAWRIADEATRFGLPEVNVGLIPGAGGTQRTPRLLGMEAAIDMAARGRLFSAREMAEMGGIDRVVTGDLRAAARAFAADLPERPRAVSSRTVAALPEDTIDEIAEGLRRKSRGQTSPLHALEALQWSALPFADGARKERARFLELKASPQSRALRHAFFAERSVARPEAIKGSTPREIARVVIVGGGLMGAGIAASCLSGGLRVTLIERDSAAADTARGRVEALVDGALERGKIDKAAHAGQRAAFTATADYAAASDADLAIEAVFEDIAVKQAVFRDLAAAVTPRTILATNTSYLDPEAIFQGIAGPERCLGLHFFSPAHIMKLLEIVRTPQTGADVLATGFALARRLGKVAVLSGICDGFIGNRMLAAYRREAEYLLADGALPGEIDAAMRAFGFAMGPWETQDLTGLQIAHAARQRQAATRDPAQRYVTIADTLCEMGRLGQRSGKGWYRYEEGGRTPQPDPEVAAVIEDYAARQGIDRRSYSSEEIAARILAVLANEGALIVEEGIAETPEAVDVVQIHGYGFPRWRGGPMHHAGEIGWETTAETMRRVAAESPNSWTLSAKLATL